MIKGIFKTSIQKQIEMLIGDLQLYLENNYKDLAIKALKDASALLETSYEQKKLNNKSYEKYKKVLSDYTQEMKDYNHQQFYRS